MQNSVMRLAVPSRVSFPNLESSDPGLPDHFSSSPHPFHPERVITDPQESARLQYLAYRSLVERAVDVFGDDIKASLWLSRPSADLDGKSPLQEAQRLNYSPAEMNRLFEPIFVRIEEGIYW